MEIDREAGEALYPDELDYIHYRVFTSHGLLPDILFNIESARKVMKENLAMGESAIIFEAREKYDFTEACMKNVLIKILP